MDRGLKNLFGLFCFVVALVLPVVGRPRTAAMCCVGVLLCRVENGNSPYPLRKLRPRFMFYGTKLIAICGELFFAGLWHEGYGTIPTEMCDT